MEIVETLQAAGGDLSRRAEEDALVLTTEVLDTNTEAALDVLADVLQNATFPADEVNLIKRNAADSLREEEADPRFLGRRALAKAVFGNHPYSVVAPTRDSIARTTLQELRQEFRKRVRPDQICLVAVGNFDLPTLKASIERRFGSWNASARSAPDPPTARAPALPHENPHAIFAVDRPGSVQISFELGTFGPKQGESDFAAAEVANAIYGGMFGSRLVKNIREDKGYTYSPATSLDSLRQTGLFRTRADVRNAVTGATLNEIDYELNRMATTSPRDDEMVHARGYLLGIQAFTLQSEASVAQQLSKLWVQELSPDEISREIDNVRKVTPGEVAAAGKKYFAAARQTIVAVGEDAVIRSQLESFRLEIRKAPGAEQ
jgi:predicted Zn-dependent peptidase